MIIRNETTRLSATVWGEGRSVWEPDGVTPTVDQLTIARGPAPTDIAMIIGPGEMIIRRRRYSFDGRPVMHATSYIPVALAEQAGLGQQDTGPGGTYARLAEAGAAPARFVVDVGADVSSSPADDEIGIGAGDPVLLERRTAIAADGHVVEVTEMAMGPGAVRLRFEFPA